MTKTKDITTAVVAPEVLRKEAAKTTQPLLAQALSVTVTDEDSYNVADTLRAKIQPIRKQFWERVTSILNPINEARQSALDLRNELTGPLDDALEHITAKMKNYRLEEAKRIREAELEKARLERAAKEADERAERAKTDAQRALQTTKAAIARADILQTTVTPVKAANSGIRTIPRWKISNIMDLLHGVLKGDVPEDVIQINEVAMNRYLRFSRKDMEQFPGVEVFDDIDIVSNRSSR